MIHDIYFQKTTDFLHSKGIETVYRTLADNDCFLPGLLVEDGKIIIDVNKLLYPGDILHEAAHIAVIPAAERSTLNGFLISKRLDAAAEEMMAIAWSYAACIFLDIDPSFVFHKNGYKEGGDNIIENFKEGRYIGVPLLQWLGMTTTDSNIGQPLYPAMIKWLRD
jgi:hypothetical protein